MRVRDRPVAILSVGGGDPTSFTYSASGNLTQTASLSLDYDPALNLTSGIASSDGATLRFAYDGLGRCILKQVSTEPIPLFQGIRPA